MRHRPGAFGALILLSGASAALAVPVVPASSDVTVAVTDLRSDKGHVLACLTAKPADFPDCRHDPQARKLTVAASEPLELDFGAVPDGLYAISLIHDENSNGKLDTALMIPREGFGFSRDAPVRMGPPRFARAAFETQGKDTRLTIRMRYML
ncbi:DUF2141 domain-containing protein [Novosphingobium sp. 9]|uniref:DUF2141 domain-containing protein n=1 Tax=Novosphingobium sp. 9 TaxID=2025349 RepID=UPI0028CBA6B5|nr:DUF2141 domain-containing protein [Novosphingobium sp. 9]